jgi:uncharacterized membrane protein HdeD (DUF308 family)
MDLHGLIQGRTMLIVRGAIAFCFGIIAANQPGISAGATVTLFGLWALGDGAATVRQAYAPTQGSRKIEVRPVLLVLGGVSLLVGLVALLGLGLSVSSAIWLLAAWFAIRVVFEVMAAVVAASLRARILFLVAAVVDVVLVGLAATHTTGSVIDLALMGGGLGALWGCLLIVIGLTTDRVTVALDAGPRLLAPR